MTNGYEPKQLWLDSLPSELFREIHISINNKFVQSPKNKAAVFLSSPTVEPSFHGSLNHRRMKYICCFLQEKI